MLYDKLQHEYPKWLEWEPETIEKIILEEEDEVKFNKILALQTVANSQMDESGFYFTDWHIFEKIVLAINEIIPDFSTVEEAEPHEIQAAIMYFRAIKDEVGFNNEVVKYIVASYLNSNIVHCPFIEEVDKRLPESKLKSKVKDLWEKIPKDKPEKIANLEDSPESVQIKRLTYVQEYTKKLISDTKEE